MPYRIINYHRYIDELCGVCQGRFVQRRLLKGINLKGGLGLSYRWAEEDLWVEVILTQKTKSVALSGSQGALVLWEWRVLKLIESHYLQGILDSIILKDFLLLPIVARIVVLSLVCKVEITGGSLIPLPGSYLWRLCFNWSKVWPGIRII